MTRGVGKLTAAEMSPFDPGDPFDAATELFRTQVTQLALDAYKVTIYRDLDPQQQIECFVAGVLTALVGVCFASVKPEGYDAITNYIAECIPTARMFAESIKDKSGHSALGKDGGS